MRQALLVVVVTLLCAAGLATPEVAILSYIWFNLMRPDAASFSTLPFSIVLASVALVSSIRKFAQLQNLVKSSITRLLLLQQVFVLLSVLFAVNMDLCWEPYDRYVRIIIMTMLIPVVITTEVWLRRLMLVMACSMGFVALKFGVFSLVFGGASLVRGYTGLISDSNGLSLAMVLLLPLCLYGRDLVDKFWQKSILLAMALFSVVTVVMAGSRGNMMAMGVCLLVVVMRSKYKLLGLIGVLLLTFPAVYLAGDRFTNRVASISEYEDDASASGRLEFWKAALLMSKDYPLFGVGYGEANYKLLAGKYMGRENRWAVHNTYLQTLADCGVIEFSLYVATLWGGIFWMGRSAARMRRLKPEWVAYPLALQTSLLGFALASTFYSRADFEFVYMVLMAAASWQLIEKRELAILAQLPTGVQQLPGQDALSVPPAPQGDPAPAQPRLRGGRPVVLRQEGPGPGVPFES